MAVWLHGTTLSLPWPLQIRCWELNESGQASVKAQQTHGAPILSCCWHPDGSKIFTASCDKTSKVWDLHSNQAVPVAQVGGAPDGRGGWDM